MHYAKLGKSGMLVSRLCLGTMNFGPQTDEKEAFRIMDAGLSRAVDEERRLCSLLKSMAP